MPLVYQDFEEIAAYADRIKYFKDKDRTGHPKHLFFHQVEGIKILMERNGGILTDEPGTGKTLILVLAALNLLDGKNTSLTQPGRVLVVGSKSVIDNWEGELANHVLTDALDIANVNFTDEREDPSFDYHLRQRLEQLEKMLKNPSHDKQIALVNYDLFRHPYFQQILRRYNFQIAIVDEAHNVKSRFLQSIIQEAQDPTRKDRVAKRTNRLYAYLREDQERVVFLATSTPFVKELVEPLIMTHLANPHLLPADKIRSLMKDLVGTYLMLRDASIRRKKEEIADLPPKETIHIAIDLDSMTDEEKARFKELAGQVMEKHQGKFARFYALLSLEAQAKFPWLVNKVNEIIADGRKVVIFTPFVTGEGRITAAISTAAIAERLYKAGITSVATLDGSLSDKARLLVQDEFRRRDGVKVLVGNYTIAGESITLCSPENRATEVILFIGPNAISRYVQAVDRVHRFGQDEKVTIHIPFVTGDLLDREQGTYDERVVSRLNDELAQFGSVIDGLFFMETKDLYRSVALSDRASVGGVLDLYVDRAENVTDRLIKRRLMEKDGKVRGRMRYEFSDPDEFYVEEKGKHYRVHDGGREIDLALPRVGDLVRAANEEEKEMVFGFYNQMQKFPLLTHEQTILVYEHMRNSSSLEALRADQRFLSLVNPKDQDKFTNLLEESQNLRDVLVYANMRLVAANIKRHFGLPFSDLLQEGTVGLMTAVEKYDPGLGYHLSTYATHWIRQALSRATDDQALIIRVPVHTHDALGKARYIIGQFETENGRPPRLEELRDLMVQRTKLTRAAIENVLHTIESGVMDVKSLNQEILPGKDTPFEHFLSDPTAEAAFEESEGRLANEKDAEVVEEALQTLDERSRQVLKMRFGFESSDMTLEQVGTEFDLTRERVRQIEVKALEGLRGNERLQALWERDLPSYAYRRSAEETAFRMGLLDSSEEKKVRKTRRHYVKSAARLVRRLSLLEGPDGSVTIDQTAKIRRFIDEARKNNEVWGRLPEEEKTILALYNRKSEDLDGFRERVGAVFGLLPKDVDKSVLTALEHAEQLISQAQRSPIYNQVKELREAHLSRGQIAKWLGKTEEHIGYIITQLIRDGLVERIQLKGPRKQTIELDEIVEVAVKSNPRLSNEALAEEASRRLNRPVTLLSATNSRSRLISGGKIEPMRVVLHKSVRVLDFKAELLCGESRDLSYRQMAEQLVCSVEQIATSVHRLLKQGKISPKLVRDKTRQAFKEYLEERHYREINLSEFAREVGVSRQYIHQLYQEMISPSS